MRLFERIGSEPRRETQTSLFTLGVSDDAWLGTSPKSLNERRNVETPTPASLPDWIGDRYRVLRALASGAMGSVLLARDLQSGDLVALKRPLTCHPLPADLRRLRREAETTKDLEHTNIVHVRDVSNDPEGLPFFTMDYLEGRSLRSVIEELRNGPRDRALGRSFVWRIRVVLQVAKALAHAHDRGILHRDVKPENIMVTPAGRAFLIDWGLAKRGARRPISGRFARCRVRGNASSSEDNTVAGTPIYMAPEALRGAVSQQTDVFSLAATLYELLTLEHYLSEEPSDEFSALALQISGVDPVPADQVEVAGQRRVPRALAKLCAKGLAKDPAERHASAAELIEELERWLAGQTRHRSWLRRRRSRRRSPLRSGLLAVGVAVCSVYLLLSLGPDLVRLGLGP